MLDYDTVLELMRKYGYSSTSIHPYIYQSGDNLGICYTYIDEEYGLLERIKIFDNIEAFELFLQEQTWLKSNSKNYNVRMILDNYESSMPKVLYLRNEKMMVEGEMFDIDTFDFRDSQRKQMDDVSKILYEAGDLLLVYDEIKSRQLQYLKKIIDLKNTLRGKYFDLQKEVDIYNKYKVERNLTLLPDVLDMGNINESLEVAIKDQYNMYVANRPTMEEIKDFIKQVWDLNLNLELNTKYYEAQKEENDIRNEIKVVEQKLELMRSLNENLRPLFGIDLVSRFKKINEKCRKESKYMSKDYVSERLDQVNKKYGVYDKLNLFYVSDYLKEAIQNTNYDGLAIKYAVNAKEEDIKKVKLPLNDVVADLTIQYKNKLNTDEQSILVLYNNSKYAKIFNTILEIDNYSEVPIKNIIKKLNAIKGFTKIKSECYDSVKKRINDPVNESIKKMLFNNVDFTNFETFITSMISKLSVLKNINNKMRLNSDINMYTLVEKVEDVLNRKYIAMTHDLNSMLSVAKDNKCMIGICLLKEKLPVLYSPYYFDLGDMYSKGASPAMEIKEMVGFDLLIERADVSIYKDDNNVEVTRYYTEPKLNENISYVDDIKFSYSTIFCKFSLENNLPITDESEVVPSSTPINNSVNVIEPVSLILATSSNESTQNNPKPLDKKDEVNSNVKEDSSLANEKSDLNKEDVAPVISAEVVNNESDINTNIENKTEIKEESKSNSNELGTKIVNFEKTPKPVVQSSPLVKEEIKNDNKEGSNKIPVTENKPIVQKPKETHDSNSQFVKPEGLTKIVVENKPDVKEEKSELSKQPKLDNNGPVTENKPVVQKPKETQSDNSQFVKPENLTKPVDQSKSLAKEEIQKDNKEINKGPVMEKKIITEEKKDAPTEVKQPIKNVSSNNLDVVKDNKENTTIPSNNEPKKKIVVKSVGSIGRPLVNSENKSGGTK